MNSIPSSLSTASSTSSFSSSSSSTASKPSTTSRAIVEAGSAGGTSPATPQGIDPATAVQTLSKSQRKNRNRRLRVQHPIANTTDDISELVQSPYRIGFKILINRKTGEQKIEPFNAELKQNPINEALTKSQKELLSVFLKRFHLDHFLTPMDLFMMVICQTSTQFINFCANSDLMARMQAIKEELAATYLMGYNSAIASHPNPATKEIKDFYTSQEFLKQLQRLKKKLGDLQQLLKSRMASSASFDRLNQALQELIDLLELCCTVKTDNIYKVLVSTSLGDFQGGSAITKGTPQDILHDLITLARHFHFAFDTVKNTLSFHYIQFDTLKTTLQDSWLPAVQKNDSEKIKQLYLELKKWFETSVTNLNKAAQIFGSQTTAQAITCGPLCVLIKGLLQDQLRIIEERLLISFFPTFLSERACIDSCKDYWSMLIADLYFLKTSQQELSVAELENVDHNLMTKETRDLIKSLDNENQDLMNLLNQLRRDHNDFFMQQMDSLPFAKIVTVRESLDQAFRSASVRVRDIQTFLNFFSGLDLPSLLKQVTALHQKQLKAISAKKTALNLDAEKAKAVTKLFKQWSWAVNEPISRYIVFLRHVQALSDLPGLTQNSLKRDYLFAPSELIHYLELTGIKEMLRVIPPVTPSITEVSSLSPSSSSEPSDDEEKKEPEKAKDKEDNKKPESGSAGIISKAPRKKDPYDVAYDTSSTGGGKKAQSEGFHVRSGTKMRKIEQKLNRAGLRRNREMRGDHGLFREQGNPRLLINLPMARRHLKPGARNNLNKTMRTRANAT